MTYLSWVFLSGMLATSMVAQYYKDQRDKAWEWVDEIVEELGGDPEDEEVD